MLEPLPLFEMMEWRAVEDVDMMPFGLQCLVERV